jgi:hypothetical protein
LASITPPLPFYVMRGLDPRIHDFLLPAMEQAVDCRV